MKSQVRLYRPGPPGLEILHRRNACGSIPAHVHASWCVVTVERGERSVSMTGRTLRLEAGDTVLIPPGVAHACASPADGCDFWAVSIGADLLSINSNGATQAADSRSPVVAKALGFLDGPEGEGMSLAELARRSGASQFHLARLFRRETGISPHEYRTLAQLRKARALLAEGTSPAEAAASCGFYDQSHLTLRFKKYMGMTPGQFTQASA